MSGLLGICGIAFGLYFIFTFKVTEYSGFYDPPSLVFLVLVPPCIMLLSHRLGDFLTGFRILFRSMFQNTSRQQQKVIATLSDCSRKIREEGMGSLMQLKKDITHELLADGINLIISNFSSEEIQHNLQSKIDFKQTKMTLASHLFENMSRVSPGVGMIGTLIGLVNMMADLSDPKSLGSGMAIALLTTLYGLIVGTLIYAPLGEKISIESEKCYQLDMMVLEGVMALKDKKSSLHLTHIVKTYGRVPETPQK
jgi:chemotaxis protein MotA